MMKSIARLTTLFYLFISLVSCMEYGPMEEENFDFSRIPDGLFILNEGNFMYGNASLSYYVPSQNRIENEVFIRANGMNLGDVAQSMTIRDGLGYLVVNNSGVIFIIDIDTFKIKGRIKGFTSPRYIHFIDDEKAYVTQLWDSRIFIVNPRMYQITGYIDTGQPAGSQSTEQMVQHGKYVFISCWRQNNTIIVIDSESDEIVDEITTDSQPAALALDRNGKIWTIIDGGYGQNGSGSSNPTLYRVDAESRKIEKTFRLEQGVSRPWIALNGQGDTIYILNGSVWKMDVTANALPREAFIPYRNSIYYTIGVDPTSGDVYVADAIDYSQPGVIYRYSEEGNLLDQLRSGITPGAFCFKR